MRALSPNVFRMLGLVSLLATVACQPRNGGSDAPDERADASQLSSISMYFDALSLSGQPNLYELAIEFPSHESLTIKRRGDLPAGGGLISETGLPDGAGVKISADLFKGQFDPKLRTHTCQAKAPLTVDLVRQQTASLTLTCYSVTNPEGVTPADVFIAVSTLQLDAVEGLAADRLGERDLSKTILFTQTDGQGRRISLRMGPSHLAFHLGGEISYTKVSADPAVNLAKDFLIGTEQILGPNDGKQIQAFQDQVTLKVSAPLMLLNVAGQTPKFIVPVELTSADGSIHVTANLMDEVPNSEFTVVAYNGENLFDQVDEDRNAGYGDYRIAPNAQGASSNYGQPVLFEGQMTTFTDVKLHGVRKVLLGVDSIGPEIIALEEVESETIIKDLAVLMREYGYVSAEFSGWPVGQAPNAIGTGILSKFPIKSKTLLAVPFPAGHVVTPTDEPIRPIFKVVLNAAGKDLTLYLGHWRSQAVPESWRAASAQAIQDDLNKDLQNSPNLDYLILGDLNSRYNEARTVDAAHNDMGNQSGINTVLNAQGDESLMLSATPGNAKYNFHYELNQILRNTHYDTRYGWTCFDHIIGGPGLYDMSGVTYIDNSFTVPSLFNPNLSFIFESNGGTKRWKSKLNGNVTTHEVGGYSDHVPVYARFFVARKQSRDKIKLVDPSKPDALDALPVLTPTPTPVP